MEVAKYDLGLLMAQAYFHFLLEIFPTRLSITFSSIFSGGKERAGLGTVRQTTQGLEGHGKESNLKCDEKPWKGFQSGEWYDLTLERITVAAVKSKNRRGEAEEDKENKEIKDDS